MDPDTTLAQIRATREAMDSPDCHAEQFALLAGDLVDHVEALDEWLTKGGFLPKAWGTRGICGARMTDHDARFGTRLYVCTRPPGCRGMHEDETAHGAPAAKWPVRNTEVN